MTTEIGRRDLLKGLGVAAASAVIPHPADAEAQPSKGGGADSPGGAGAAATPENGSHAHNAPEDEAFVYFTAPEAAFVRAAVDRLIPADPSGPGAVEAGVVRYIDRQLAGAFGRGDRMYLAGPWPDTSLPTQGYQLPLTPAELYRLSIAEIDKASRKANAEKPFAELDFPQQEAMLHALERGEFQLETMPGTLFFELLLANTIEGYFADPAYGGNRDMGAWRMFGFPGARGDYADLIIPYRNTAFDEEPVSLSSLQ